MTPRILDGTYVELWNVKAWRRKLGIGDEAPTLAQRIEVLVVGGSVDNANARLAAFSTLEETGYVVQTALSPPTFAGREILGTLNQVDVVNGDGIAGNTTLSLPQDIHTGASPEFQTIRPSLLTPEFVTYVNAVGELDSTGVTADELNTIAAGTPGYFPYWLGTGGLASTSPIFTDGTYTGVGVDVLGTPITPDTPLHVWVQDFNHSAVTDLLKLDHYDPVGMAAGGGTGLLFSGSSDTVANREMGRIQTRWTVAADATRAAAMDFQTATAGGVLSTKVTILESGFVGIGTTVPSSLVHANVLDAATTATTTLHTISHNTTNAGGAGANFGSRTLWNLETDTTPDQNAFAVDVIWSTATDATRTSRMSWFNVNSGSFLERMRFTGDGRLGVGRNITLTASTQYFPITVGALFPSYVIITSNVAQSNELGGLRVPIQIAGSGAFSDVRGIHVDVSNTNTNTGTVLNGLRVRVGNDISTARASTIRGAVFAVDTGSATGGTFGEISGLQFSFAVNSAGPTVTSAYGCRVLSITNAGTITNTFGYWVGDISAGTQTNTPYSFYASDINSWNYFGGRVGVGTTSPAVQIHATIDDAVTNAATDILKLNHSSTGTPTAGFGTGILFSGESSTTDIQDMARMQVVWTTATHATRTSAIEWQTVNSAAALATRMALSGAGGLSIGDGTNTIAVGVINAVTGFRVNNTNATAGWLLTSDGTNFIPAAPPATIATPVSIANGGTNNTTFNTNSVIFYDGVRLTDDGAAFTYAAAGDNQLLLAKTLGNVQNDNVGYYALNSAAALAGAANQQWSPSFLWEGQGWGGSSQAVKYRAYVVPVDAATNPTGYWILERQIAALGYVELLRADSTGYLRITKDDLRSIDTTLAQSVFGLHLTNNTTSTGAITTQDAPPIIFKGQARNTTANTSHDWRWRMLMKGVTNVGTTRSYLRIDSGADGSNFGNPIVMSSAGGLSVGALIEAAFGVVSSQVGYQIAGGATAGHALISNGTNFISQALTSALVAYAFTAGSVLFAGPGGTSIAQDNANLFYDDTANALCIGTNATTANARIRATTAIARTTNTFCYYLTAGDTSATNNIFKVGLYIDSSGAWSGTGTASVRGVQTLANGSSVENTGGYFEAEGSATISHGLWGVGDASGTTSIGVRGTASNTATTNVGGYFEATAGVTNNYAIYCANGTTRLAAGTTTVAPLLFASGVDLTAPTAGVMEYDGRFELTDVDAVRRHIVQAVNATKVTAGAPYANDGYVNMVIGGTTVRVMTTA